MSQEFTEPFDQPIVYGRCIASLANMLSGSIVVQRFGDLKEAVVLPIAVLNVAW